MSRGPSGWAVGVVAQRLMRISCADCKVPVTYPPETLAKVGLGPEPDLVFYRGQGCEKCGGTGYRGRTGIYEMFLVDEDVRGLIIKKASAGQIRRHAIEHGGLVTLRDDGWTKARSGVTTVEELLRVTQEES